MSDFNPLSETVTLDALARLIEGADERSVAHTLEAATLLGEARRRVLAGDAGDITWEDWAKANLKIRRTRVYELLSIVDAEDSSAKVVEIREKAKERGVKHRAAKKSAACAVPATQDQSSNTHAEAPAQIDPEPERAELIAWAKSAPLDEVRRLLAMTKNLHIPQPANDDVPSAA